MLKAFAVYHDIFGAVLDTGGTTCFSIRKPVAGASILLATDYVLHDSCFFGIMLPTLLP